MIRKQPNPHLARIPNLLLKIGLSLFGLALAVIFCFRLGERFFFDQLFYRKSALHGYMSRYAEGSNPKKNNFVNEVITSWRENNLRRLIAGYSWPTSTTRTFKVAIIGDSFSYGFGVLASERFSVYLGPELEKIGLKAQVFNFSEPGNSIVDYFALYQLIKNQLNPDFIIIGINTNDLLLNDPRYPGTTKILNQLDQLCPQLTYEYPTNYETPEEYNKIEVESFSSQWANRCYLKNIAKILAIDPKVRYFSFEAGEKNPICSYETNYLNGLINTEYISILQQAGLKGYVNIDHALGQVGNVSNLEGHPSKSAHKLFAREMAKLILGQLQ